MKDPTLHVVAIGAHPDDIELSMGGLSIRYAHGGHRTTWIVATDGAAGSGGRDRALAQRRRLEAQAGAELAGASLISLDLPDGQLAWQPELHALIGAQLTSLAPDLIVTHAVNDYHPDHRAVARIVGDTAPIGVPILRADNMLGLHFTPELLVDVSEVFELKLEALGKHESQASLGIADAVRTWNRFRGLQSNSSRFNYAEAYALDRRLTASPQSVLDVIGGYCAL